MCMHGIERLSRSPAVKLFKEQLIHLVPIIPKQEGEKRKVVVTVPLMGGSP